MNAELERIKSIKSFPSVVKYLREELGWKIDDADIDDLTFDYEPAELGIDKETAVKIKEIKQLRPLTTNQPWGIFYLSFEPKRLPIVALRRILRSLVIKKRESANRSQMATWEQNDLLFISSYGEQDNRELTFAHFSDNTGMGDLPTLKVLGWSAGNTVLRLEDTYKTLNEKLHWPDNDADVQAWREQWSSAFKLQYRETVRTSKDLATRLADLAIVIRESVNEVLTIETEKGELRKLYKAFQEALIHDLTEDDFADMYAQTIAYGLLSARISRTSGALVADNLSDLIPNTNPFLKELMQTFLTVGGRKSKIDFDELGINEVVELLRDDRTQMEEVLKDFGAKNPNEDPVIHFYELFLKEYDPEKRMKRGVFYTPRPVVSFIVRSVDEILRNEFGLADGLADTTTWGEMKARNKDLVIPEGVKDTAPFVQILDPATGTGTFLVEVIDLIFTTMSGKWRTAKKSETEIRELWNEYVPRHLLPRVYGFELMMAPYSIAHMKIGLKLRETGYSFISSERAQIYLTNTLEEPKEFPPYLATMAPALAHEAEAANCVKRQTPITVIIGNPPYSGVAANKGEWIETLMSEYKVTVQTEERQIQRLSNDYVKFIRYGQETLRRTNSGILSFISDNGYVDGLLFRDMRQSLLGDFSTLGILNLHGALRRSVDSLVDQNVFEIIQGVAISFFTKQNKNLQIGNSSYSEIFGTRQEKYDLLNSANSSQLGWQDFYPQKPAFYFTMHVANNEYIALPSIPLLFGTGNMKNDRDTNYGTGIKTRHDEFVIGWDRLDAVNRVKKIAFRGESDPRLISELGLCTTAHFNIKAARKKAETENLTKFVRPIQYRPFDNRYIVYQREFVCEPKTITMKHMIPENIALCVLRRDRKSRRNGYFVSKGLIAKDLVSNLDDALVLPVLRTETENLSLIKDDGYLTHNFSPSLLDLLKKNVQIDLNKQIETDGNYSSAFDVVHYIYSILYSPSYREIYGEELDLDFPRLPLTNDTELFRKLCSLGAELVAIHLLEGIAAPRDWNLRTDGSTLFENAEVAAGFPKYEDGKIFINKTAWFDGVEEEIWNFHIGGYQVCHKWLKDRKGRTLAPEDIAHYGKITVALRETIRLMAEIDDVIEAHGGFPLVGSQDAAT